MVTSTKGSDRRVTRTKRAIRDAFMQLLSEKDLNAITVKEISERANINRKTFYNYYSGVYQVMDAIENEIVGDFETVLRDVDLHRHFRNPNLFFERLNSIINSDIDFYGCLLKMGINNLTVKTVSMLKKNTKAALAEQLSLDDMQLEVTVDYLMSGMMAVYQTWFNSGRREPLDELSRTVETLCVYGIDGLLF